VEEGIGLYIHIPFCLSKCPYCAFSSVAEHPSREFVSAIRKELDILSPGRVRTLYAGGGTPTLIGASFWAEILSSLDLPLSAEATVETNPAVLKPAEYRAMRNAGFNRLSIGVQSFNHGNLALLGRIHTGSQTLEAVAQARAGGFENISIDLIYGLPGQSTAQWETDLEKALLVSPDHISCYELTLEPGTPTGDQGRRASDDSVAEMHRIAHRKLAGEGFRHYEVSNYALPGKESAHNLAYWERRPYAGAGPSAHGFTGTRRYWNTRDNVEYLKLLKAGILPRAGSEGVTPEMARTEEIMLGLRTLSGVSESILPANRVEDLIARGLLARNGDRLHPTPEGMLWADGMAGELAV
jgi:oxygen-independent coproporphyrinogen-3 oxidase